MSKMEYGMDEEGHEILLKDGHYQVMMAWEKPYMEACIDALKPSGDVLEVGFGFGYSATRVQHYHPRTHTIIECEPVVAKRAREWAKNHQGVTIIEKTWQEALPQLGQYDAVFFDDYPLEEPSTVEKAIKEADKVVPIVNEGRQKMKEIKEQLPQLETIKYSDNDLHAFAHAISKEEKHQLPRFFFDLYKNHHITRSQLEKLVSKEEIEKAERGVSAHPARNDRLFAFLVPCFDKHLRVGGRFSCFIENPVSKYRDPLFEKHVITNPFVEYTEKVIKIHVPKHCRYYHGSEALVITITKRGGH
jgi:protein-L-isoaspartate O-methyltransferase